MNLVLASQALLLVPHLFLRSIFFRTGKPSATLFFLYFVQYQNNPLFNPNILNQRWKHKVRKKSIKAIMHKKWHEFFFVIFHCNCSFFSFLFFISLWVFTLEQHQKYENGGIVPLRHLQRRNTWSFDILARTDDAFWSGWMPELTISLIIRA